MFLLKAISRSIKWSLAVNSVVTVAQLRIIKADSPDLVDIFLKTGNAFYSGNKYYRECDSLILDTLLHGKSAFLIHATIFPCLVIKNDGIVGRFVLIHDRRLVDHVQVAFFEAHTDLVDLAFVIEKCVLKLFSGTRYIVFGMNGHLNYGAGILLDSFDKVPLFGLNYHHFFYQGYFLNYRLYRLITYQFKLPGNLKFAENLCRGLEERKFKVRPIDRRKLRKELSIYTDLSNICFANHPLWSKRDPAEDHEMFLLFRRLIHNENMLIAEYHGKPVGFLLWFPDFNELRKSNRRFKKGCFGADAFGYRLSHHIKTIRLAEIGIIPEFQKKGVEALLFREFLNLARRRNYRYGEGGFIFEQNTSSNNMVRRYLKRISAARVEPYRVFGVFLKELSNDEG